MKNPRSQVAKAAVQVSFPSDETTWVTIILQTFTKLFSLLGQLVEREKIFEEIVATLLVRTGDTNKFIRKLNQNNYFLVIIRTLYYSLYQYIIHIKSNSPKV